MFSFKYNMVPILLVLLAGFMVYDNRPNYGWVIVAALLITVVPSSHNTDDEDDEDND